MKLIACAFVLWTTNAAVFRVGYDSDFGNHLHELMCSSRLHPKLDDRFHETDRFRLRAFDHERGRFQGRI
jgi:hypothetical protein